MKKKQVYNVRDGPSKNMSMMCCPTVKQVFGDTCHRRLSMKHVSMKDDPIISGTVYDEFPRPKIFIKSFSSHASCCACFETHSQMHLLCISGED